MKILGYVMAGVVVYIVGYLITVWVLSKIESIDDSNINADERKEIMCVCLIWPILFPFAILMLVGYFVKNAADKIIDGTNDRRED